MTLTETILWPLRELPLRLKELPLWVREQAWMLAGLLALLGAGAALVALSASGRDWRLRRRRRGADEERFKNFLERFGFDRVIAGSTYRYLRDVGGVRFPILPGDRLESDLRLHPEEVTRAQEDLAGALGREWLPGMRADAPVTVEDLVRTLQALPRKVASPGETGAKEAA